MGRGGTPSHPIPSHPIPSHRSQGSPLLLSIAGDPLLAQRTQHLNWQLQITADLHQLGLHPQQLPAVGLRLHRDLKALSQIKGTVWGLF